MVKVRIPKTCVTSAVLRGRGTEQDCDEVVDRVWDYRSTGLDEGH